jgi:hypothetical protein
VEVGLGQRGDGRRAAKALLSLASLDPASLVSKRLGDADVVVLAGVLPEMRRTARRMPD